MEDLGTGENHHRADHSDCISMFSLLRKEIDFLKSWRMEVLTVLELHGITLDRCPLLSESLESKNVESTRNPNRQLSSSQNVDSENISVVEGAAEMVNNVREETPTKTQPPVITPSRTEPLHPESSKTVDEPRSQQQQDVGLDEETPRTWYRCEYCSSCYSSYDDMLAHSALAHACPQCPKKYKRKYNRDRHIQQKHTPECPGLGPPEEKKARPRPQNRKRASSKRQSSALVPLGQAPLLSVNVGDTTGSSTTTTIPHFRLEEEIRSIFYSFESIRRGRSERSYLCIVCGKICNDERHVRQHIINNHVCPFCSSNKAMNADELKAHIAGCDAAKTAAVTSDSGSRAIGF